MTVVPAYNLKKRGVGEGPSEINKCASDGKVDDESRGESISTKVLNKQMSSPIPSTERNVKDNARISVNISDIVKHHQ